MSAQPEAQVEGTTPAANVQAPVLPQRSLLMSAQTSHAISTRAVFTRRAFDQAIRPLYAPLCRHASARCGAEAGPDLVQSALCCAWSVIERFDAAQSPGRLLGWLRRFVDYACDD